MRSALLVLVALPAACLLVRDVDDLEREARDGGNGALADAAGDADAEPAFVCGGDAGPRGVRIGNAAACIDATEVTVADYRAFHDACNGRPCPQPATCAWNRSFTPTEFGLPPPSDDRLPMRNVDWCDAAAYCTWAGKRLCGGSGNATLTTADGAALALSLWYQACVADDSRRTYPYGDGRKYDPNACNGGDLDAGEVRPVGSLAGCEGGFPGIFDLLGNVREWEDACDDAGTDDARTCLVRGGAFYDIGFTLACGNRQTEPVTRQAPGLGFRCCSF